MTKTSNKLFGFPDEMRRLERDFCGDSSLCFFWEEANYVAHFAVEELSREGHNWTFVMRINDSLLECGKQNAGESEWLPDWRKTILEISDKAQISQSTLHYCVVLEALKHAIECYNENHSQGASYFLTYAGINLGMAFGPAGHVDFLNFARKKSSLEGAGGGKKAAQNRSSSRKKVAEEVASMIANRKLWDNWSNTAKSITDTIWEEIKTAIESGKDWQGISKADLLQTKIGRQSIYDAVKETDPR